MYKELKNCLACSSGDLSQYISFGIQPLANNFSKREYSSPYLFPLEAMHCKDCGHNQLSIAVDPRCMYSNYSYVSGTTETLKKHFQEVAQYSLKHSQYPNPRILEIGINDGTLADCFINLGANRIEGVDPAENIRPITKKKKIPVLVDFWSSKTANKLLGDFDIVIGCNVFAHNADPFDFLKGVSRILSDNGVCVLEFPYGKSTFEIADHGQYYFEHVNYFNVSSFAALAERALFQIIDVVESPIHGGSIRFVIRKSLHGHCTKARNLICNEDNSMEKCYKFASKVKENIRQLGEMLESFDSVIAYGASAKSSTLFNYPGFKTFKVKYVVDDSPFKQNLYYPVSGTKIKSPEELKKEENPVILLTVHNFKKEVLERLVRMGIKGKLINYTPEVTIEDI